MIERGKMHDRPDRDICKQFSYLSKLLVYTNSSGTNELYAIGWSEYEQREH